MVSTHAPAWGATCFCLLLLYCVMKKDIKEKIMIISALTTLASGIVLSFLSFFLSSYHIDYSVLWYFAQCLMYAGSCFGIGAYITKFKNEVNEKIDNNKKL